MIIEGTKRANSYKHGEDIKGKVSRLYRIWSNMIQRTTNSQAINYNNYGGRGISVCKEWRDFIMFRNWAYQNGYKENLQIDRINPNGNYCPDNCRFVTSLIQQLNKRKNSDCNIHKEGNIYCVRVCRNYRRYYGGHHRNKEDAIKARDKLLIDIEQNIDSLKYYKNGHKKREDY